SIPGKALWISQFFEKFPIINGHANHDIGIP
ncbi:MAG: hypothetical protein RIR70_426, partial [Pseudomonadota bacterium]